jgi:hypothetical protein
VNYENKPGPKPGSKNRPETVKPCGTRAAYHRHLAHREIADAACLAAEAAYKRERYAAAKEAGQ